ncbi:MAG: hypothetical protein QM674_22555, partial [Burkholderiaceae bacterium]
MRTALPACTWPDCFARIDPPVDEACRDSFMKTRKLCSTDYVLAEPTMANLTLVIDDDVLRRA